MNLAQQFSDLKESLLNLYDNIKDLMIPFQNKAYYHYKMCGSYSIKYVLLALCENFESAYKNLELIHSGGETMQAFANMNLQT